MYPNLSVYNENAFPFVNRIFQKINIPSFRKKIYEGEIFQFSSDSWKPIKNLLWKQLEQFLGPDPLEAEKYLSTSEHFERISRVRENLYGSPDWMQGTIHLLSKFAFREPVLFDIPRIRAIVSLENCPKEAEPAFFPHRDTWYGNSSSQINFWIPLIEIFPENGFGFFPNYFSKPVKNNSKLFDYQKWKENGGYQSFNKTQRIFPTIQETIPERERRSFFLKQDQAILFSGSHLHGTNSNLSGFTRFSIDMRIVFLNDHENNLGAPNVDNEAKGWNRDEMILLN
jgi:hypothetical protein